MSGVFKRYCMLLLALPVAALAEPVVVKTHSIGTSLVHNTVLGALGLDSVESTVPIPFELTLTSTFLPGPLFSEWAYNDGGEVEIDFSIGDQNFHYVGAANSSVNLYAHSLNYDSYNHYISFDTPGPTSSNYTLGFIHTLYSLPGSHGQNGPLAPLYADESDGAFGYYTIRAAPSNPDVPLSWEMSSANAALSVQVVVIPEPAPFALLTAGLLALGLVHRSRRRTSSAAADRFAPREIIG